MKCPDCMEQARKVSDVKHREDPDGYSLIVRTRRCPNGHIFSTYECYEYADVEVVFKARAALVTVQQTLESIISLDTPERAL